MHNFDEAISRKGTFSTQWDFIGDRFGREDILPFSISDTDFKVPQPIIDKLEEVAKFGIYGYTRWNHDSYRKTIQTYFLNEYNTEIDDKWVIYSPSVMYSVSILIRLLKTKEKPRVLTFTPMYDSFYTVISENGCDLVTSTLFKKDGKFEIDFNDFELKVKECSVFLLCSPHNPTGKVFTTEEINRMVEICAMVDVKVISDEIHMDLTLDQSKRTPLYKTIHNKDTIYTASSASKVFNIPGLGGSFVVIAHDAIKDAFLKITKTRDFVNSANIMGMWATIVGYESCSYYVSGIVEHTLKNLTMLKEFIDLECPLISFDIPEATYLAWLDISKLPCTPNTFLKTLEDIGKVGFMGGKHYGDESYIRINCGCTKLKLQAGMEGLKKAYDSVVNNT